MKRRIRLSLQRLIGNLFEGIFASSMNALHGMELDELRQYQPGDDIRAVDWKTTIKTGKLHVRMKLVDKRVTVLFLIDRSWSGKFGTFQKTKEDVQADVLSILVHAASETGNEIGFVTFTDTVENYIKPKSGEKEALKNIRNILLEKTSGTNTDLNVAFKFINEKHFSPALVFVISDFLAPCNYEQSLKTLSSVHEVIPVIISDRTETYLPAGKGLVAMQDIETGQVRLLDISHALHESLPCLAILKKLAIDHLALSTEQDEEIWIKKISEFFDRRIRRRGRRR